MIQQLVDQLTPELYQRLATAVETGKWPGGERLSDEQRGHALQLVMLYQSRHGDDREHMTIGPDGQIIMKSKRELKEQFRPLSEILRQPTTD